MKTAHVVLLLAMGCHQAKPPAPESDPVGPAHHDETPHDALPRQVRLSQEAVSASGLETELSRRAVLAMTVSLAGEIVAEPDKSARVASTTAGRLERVDFNEGAIVKKGAVLAVVRVPDVGRLRGAFAAASAKAKAARLNAGRLGTLKANGLGSEQAIVDAEAEAQSQEAEATAIDAQLAAIGVSSPGGGSLVSLVAPIAGVVVSRDAVVGQPVDADHVLATIVDLSEVWFLGRVFEKDLSRLATGVKADVQLNAFPGQHFEGAVEYLGQQTDRVARTLTVRIRLKNADSRLRLGLFGSAQVEVSEKNPAAAQVLIRRSAVTNVGGQNIVFVKEKDGDFMVHEVTLGDAALSEVQVLSGLSEGEEVVTHGVFTLKSLLLKSTLNEDEH